ncbi:hypothetical protein J6590_055208 [Homalodisca vitripennis]|nr:hypothetical protein J6590_055208 [Homalodisca vitripennis]
MDYYTDTAGVIQRELEGVGVLSKHCNVNDNCDGPQYESIGVVSAPRLKNVIFYIRFTVASGQLVRVAECDRVHHGVKYPRGRGVKGRNIATEMTTVTDRNMRALALFLRRA